MNDEPEDDDETVERGSLVGVPEGVGPPISPDCPICTGGRGVPCAWHGSADRHDP